MRDYVAIQNYIDRAQISRSVYLAEILSTAIVGAWNGIKHAADFLYAVARAKTRNNVFTFDA